MIRPHRTHALWYAFVLHRLSGLALALFLPLHFYMLSLALTDPAQLDGFLAFTDLLIVKCAEFALVFFAGRSYVRWATVDGIGIFAMEFTPENICCKYGGIGICDLNRLFSTGDLNDATIN